jgi:hypothetical protein
MFSCRACILMHDQFHVVLLRNFFAWIVC